MRATFYDVRRPIGNMSPTQYFDFTTVYYRPGCVSAETYGLTTRCDTIAHISLFNIHQFPQEYQENQVIIL